jgi:sensor c-di-GMP phosphodiesterase-like protein
VKVHNRYRFSRLWISAVVILLGVLAGYSVGQESIRHAIHERMTEYTDQLLEHDEEIAGEVRSTLIQAGESTYKPCSEEDIALLRRLTFKARYLKDVGRLEDGRFACSATAGNLATPLPMLKPDMQAPDGMRMYEQFPLSVPAGDFANIVASSNADVVVAPDTFSDFPQLPIHYSAGISDPKMPDQMRMDAASRDGLLGVTGQKQLPSGLLQSSKVVRAGNVLYRARCSSRFPVCVVTYVPVAEVWRSNRGLMLGYLGTGTTSGVGCALALLLAGRKKRSQTNQLKRAILMGKLSVAYQPIVELGTHRIVGAEALARWTDEDGDSIRPETIIALAEAEGFVSEITRFVITRSIEELTEVFENIPDFRLNINLAPSDLADPRLLLLLDEKLSSSVITAANLNFELTERATSDKDVAVAAIRRLRQRGHGVFIDDFGTGYSNLAYLTELNVDGIKINRSFIATLGTDSVTASIVPQILAVARAFGLQVVVQGIEREEQAKYFALDDPQILGQGWFFGQPIPARSLLYLCAERSE